MPLALVAFGQAVVLLAGRIDLSVGSIVSLSTVMLATTSAELGLISIPLTIAAGLACGALNAAGVIFLRLNPLIMTLATSAIVKGISLLFLSTPGGEVDYGFYDAFYGQDQFWGWPLLIICTAFAALFLALGFTRFGRSIYALGSDGRAAFANGVNVAAIDVSVFVISGGIAALAGVAVGIKILSGDPLIGDSLTLDAIAAACWGAWRCRADAATSSACLPHRGARPDRQRVQPSGDRPESAADCQGADLRGGADAVHARHDEEDRLTMAAYLARLRPADASLRAVALLVLLLAVFFISARGFSATLLLDNVRQAAPLGIVVAGQALVLMMGRLDLSVGATASMANIVLCAVFNSDMANLVPAVAAALGAGVLVGSPTASWRPSYASPPSSRHWRVR